VSLDALLTPTHLRALAGYAYARGVDYMRRGRVKSCEVTPSGLAGVDAGTQPYEVRVFAHGRGLHAECACRVAGPMCKHGVARALWHLEGRDAPVREAPSAGRGFASRRELIAWAEQHHVMHELAMSAARLAPDIGRASWRGRV